MKMVLIMLLVIDCFFSVGQNAEEWFQQNKTQKKYLLQQIAALKMYIDYAEKGYSIASKGLRTIQNAKKGDFNLHRDFFGSLKTVNPKIKNCAKVADIIAGQLRILKGAQQTIRNIRETKEFTPGEIEYCSKVFERLIKESMDNIDELALLLKDGEFELKDDERMNRIDKLYIDMQDKSAFCHSFGQECKVLAIQRMGEKVEVDLSKKLQGY